MWPARRAALVLLFAIALAAVASAAARLERVAVAGQAAAGGGTFEHFGVAGGPAPGIPAGTLASVDAPALNDRGAVAFLASVRRGRESVEAVYVADHGRLRKVAAQGDPAPAGGSFAGFGPPAINARGAVAFAAIVEGKAVPGGIFLADGERIRMLAGAGEDTAVGGIFLKF